MATAQDVCDRAREVLNDPGKVRWTDVALFLWLSDAIDIVRVTVPRLFIQRGNHTTIPGSLQTLILPKARDIVDVVGVARCSKESLDQFNPAWQLGTQSATPVNWMPSAVNPKSFLIYPPCTGGQSLPVEYAFTPGEITALSDTLPLPDDFVSPLADYVIAMANAKEAEQVDSGAVASFAQSYASKIGQLAK